MRGLLITLNGGITALFLFAFVYTFVGSAHLTSVARDFAASKTADYAEPIVDLAEEAAQSKAIRLALSSTQEAAIADEFARYHEDPRTYIAELTGQAPTKELNLPENSFTKKLKGWKVKVRDHYDEVLKRILADLRIFSGTNLIVGLASFLLAMKARKKELKPLIWLSGLLSLAACISIYGFIDTFSFYEYLFNWHMGWSYPLTLFLIYLYLIIRLYRYRGEPT